MNTPSNSSQTFTTIWWLKKDFRLHDNPALTAALASDGHVLALFVVEPSALAAPETSAFHVAAWIEAANALRSTLQQAGGELLIVHGEVIETLSAILSITTFSQLTSHEEIGSERTFTRDKEVAKWCRENQITWKEQRQTAVFRALKNRNQRTQLWNEWMGTRPLDRPPTTALARLIIPASINHLGIPQFTLEQLGFTLDARQQRSKQRVTETDAEETLTDFLERRSFGYHGGISSPNSAAKAGSRLSVHLAWGTITGRRVYFALLERMHDLKQSDDPNAVRFRRSLSNFNARLHWRDHFMQRLESEPNMDVLPLNLAYEALETSDDPLMLQAWVDGKTGFPLVDACIRSAQTTGFLNFRMRSMITSVACHAMRLDWRDIMWPMAQWWADYEPGIHVSQIQMQAGVVGINTLRTYNPAKQILDQDPKTHFIKHWIPELRQYTPEDIAAHQDCPLPGYIEPVVNWKESSAAMRANFYNIRSQPETKALAQEVFKKHGSRKRPTQRKTINKATKKKTSKKQDTNQLELPI